MDVGTTGVGAGTSRNPTEDQVVLRRGWRRTFEFLIMGVLAYISLGILALPFIGAGPVDYQIVPLMIIIAAVVSLFTLLPSALFGARRRVRMTPAGPRPGLTWADVEEVGTVTLPFNRRVMLRLRGGRRLLMYQPEGSWWRRDPAFHRDAERVREYANRHGASVGAVRTGTSAPIRLAVAAALLAGLGVVTWKTADRGIIVPWQPHAVVYAASACAALTAAGLDQAWPAEQRELTEDSRDRAGYGQVTTVCWWDVNARHYQDSTYSKVRLEIATMKGDLVSSPIGSARRALQDDQDRTMATYRLNGVGDRAFVGVYLSNDRAEAGVADVVVTVDVHSRTGERGTGLAERILRGVVVQISV